MFDFEMLKFKICHQKTGLFFNWQGGRTGKSRTKVLFRG